MMRTEPTTGPAISRKAASPRLSVIIVNYNVRYFLEQALLSVRRASQGLDIEVFVVDNDSGDDSVAMLREKFPEVKLIVNRQNVGFAVANNQAIRLSKGEFVLLLNPDTVVEEDTFFACLDYLDKHPKAGALGVKMIDGSGAFLPESKRGFPSPWVAFCKTVGLSSLFPASKVFNGYYLGYLDREEVQEVDVLAGAFMMLRREALDRSGLLDEQFFMYGEDIDLSWRIVEAGYTNVYFPHTSIIHYKGESTRKGSLNYVRTFYQAMILFAKKHFRGQQAWFLVLILRLAIYFQAAVALLRSFLRRLTLPLLDGAFIFGGLLLLKDFWATYHFHDTEYYSNTFLLVNAPLYTLIWVASIFFSGAYDIPDSLRRLLRGLLVGTVLLAAIYGFLDLEYRTSRALILLGAVWAALATIGIRFAWHLLRYGNLRIGGGETGNLVIVGTKTESERVQLLLRQAGVQKNIIGTIAPGQDPSNETYLSGLEQLDDVVHIYHIDDIVFCSKDVLTRDITHWMSRLGPDHQYRIVPEDSLSIIGSRSKNAPGELYTIEVQFAIAQALQRRNKRILDLGLSVLLLATLPIHLLWLRPVKGFVANIFRVFFGRNTWVGYGGDPLDIADLPEIRQGILHPEDGLKFSKLDRSTRARLDLLYAKDYNIWRDLDIIWMGRANLGRKP